MISAVNRRSFPRFPVRLEASAISPHGTSVDCTIYDFCRGGMFLALHSLPGGEVSWGDGDSIIVSFPAAANGVAEDFRVYGHVARVVDGHLGIAFEQLDGAAFDFLMGRAHSAERQAEKRHLHPLPAANAAAITAECREKTRRMLEGLVERFISQAVTSLDQSDELSKKNWRGVLETQQKLHSGQQQLSNCYVDSVLKGLDYSSKGAVPAGDRTAGNELSLIEDQEFQNWLTITALVSKLESHNEEALFGLEPRLSVVLNRPIRRQNNPIGAHSLVQQFQECFDMLPLDDSMKKIVFRAFENVALTEVGIFYQQLDRYLKEKDILPELKKSFRVIRQPGGSRPRSAPAHSSPPEHAREGAVSHDRHPVVTASAAEMVPPSGGGAALAVGESQAETVELPAAMNNGDYVVPSPYSAVNELLQLERAGLRNRAATARYAAGAGGGHDAEGTTTASNIIPFSPQELNSGLAQLHREGVHVRQLRQQGSNLSSRLTELLAAQNGGSEKQLPLDIHDKLDVTESLLSSIQTDAITDARLKDWFEQIELPFIQIALDNEQVLQDRSHPIHHLFNTLDHLFQMLPPEQSELRQQLMRKVEAALKSLDKANGGDAEAMDEAVNSLEKIYGEQSNEYRQRVDALVAQCNAEPNTRQQTLEMLQDIDRMFDEADNRKIPRVVLELLDAGWKNLLWRYFQQEGVDGERYRSSRATMEQVLERLLGLPLKGIKADWPNSRLIEEISKVLERINKQDTTALELVADLIASLELANEDPSKTECIQKGYIAEAMLTSWEEEKAALRPVDLSKVEWKRWLERASTMDDGELISFKSDKAEPVQQKLIWSDRKWGRYIFADREGNKGLDLKQEEVAAAMSKGRLLILEGWDRPLMDRATYTMLQSIQDRLIEQTNHDPLTGMLNRRGFESALDELLVRARKDGSSNVICYLDLDRFNVVNATCGHEAGDELVGNVASIVRQNVGDDTVIARLGGDEFALILESCDREHGLKRASEIRRAINDFRFTCENKDFAVDASFGLAEVHPRNDSVRSLLTAVDSACFAAKEAGRGRIEFYDAGSEVIKKRQGVMEWVGRINTLFDKGLIQLKCQRIASMRHAASERPRYEILLQVRNEQGEQVSLEQFVLSAEIYNRILDIDRWVVNKVFAWMKENRARLNNIHSLSINLSGHSIEDEAFMNSLVDRLERAEVPSGQLCFEITETATMTNVERAAYFMRRLHQTGAQLALDDFGVGHASYSYLKSLPVDYVKIDGSFIRNIGTNIFDFSVVKSIHEMARALGKRTIAEYVESEIALNKLRKIGVDFGQGYIIEKPKPIGELLYAGG